MTLSRKRTQRIANLVQREVNVLRHKNDYHRGQLMGVRNAPAAEPRKAAAPSRTERAMILVGGFASGKMALPKVDFNRVVREQPSPREVQRELGEAVHKEITTSKVFSTALAGGTLRQAIGALEAADLVFGRHLSALVAQAWGGRPTTLEHARAMVDSSRGLRDTLKGQVAILEGVRVDVPSVGYKLVLPLYRLRGDVATAERMVDSRSRMALDLVSTMLVKDGADPREAARMLRTVGLDAPLHAQALAARAIPGKGGVHDRQRQAFVDAVVQGFQP